VGLGIKSRRTHRGKTEKWHSDLLENLTLNCLLEGREPVTMRGLKKGKRQQQRSKVKGEVENHNRLRQTFTEKENWRPQGGVFM